MLIFLLINPKSNQFICSNLWVCACIVTGKVHKSSMRQGHSQHRRIAARRFGWKKCKKKRKNRKRATSEKGDLWNRIRPSLFFILNDLKKVLMLNYLAKTINFIKGIFLERRNVGIATFQSHTSAFLMLHGSIAPVFNQILSNCINVDVILRRDACRSTLRRPRYRVRPDDVEYRYAVLAQQSGERCSTETLMTLIAAL